jgi:transposase
MKTITLTMKEQNRAAILSKLAKGKEREITTAMVAESLGIGERQVFRLKARYKAKGVLGLAHGNRGRPSLRKMPKKLEERIVKLARGKYQGFNDHHLTEKLCEVEGITVSRRKVSYLLRDSGVEAVRKKRRPKHRTRRERKAQVGLMLQTDGSKHDWLEGRGPRLTFLGLIDDATNLVPDGFFDEEETTLGYLQLFYETFSRYGLPVSIYADRHMIFQTPREATVEEQLQSRRPATQVGRALRELGITLIPAYSSQAKGRVERLWGTFQDRLVSELRLAKATNKQQANAIAKKFIPQFNHRFTVAPANPNPAWRPIPKNIDLMQILCIKEQRTVANDNTVSYNGTTFQIPKSNIRSSFAKAKVEVRELINENIHIGYKNQTIAKFSPKTIQLNALQQTISDQDDLKDTPKITERIAA